MNNPPPPKKKKKRKTKRKQKEQVRQQGRITHLRRRRYMKRNTSIRTPHGKTPPPKTSATRQAKKTLFFSVFWPPRKSGTNFEDNFSAANKTKTKNKRNGPKIENAKIGKRYFPLTFLMPPKGRVNKRAGGWGVDTARSTAKFLDPLFWGSNFKGRACANDIILQR